MTTPDPLVTFMLHSTTRGPANRTARAALPGRLRKKNFIGTDQLRLIHGKPVMITKEVLIRNFEEIKAKAAGQILEVRTMDGRVLDLNTMETPPLPATTPAPDFPLDSINRDTPWGEKMAPHHGDNLGADETQDTGLPELMAQAPREVSPDAVDTGSLPPDSVDSDGELEAAMAAAADDEGESSDTEAPPADEEAAPALVEEHEVVSEGSSKKGKNKKGNR